MEHLFAQSGLSVERLSQIVLETKLHVLLQQSQLFPEDDVAERMIGFAFDN
jgi:hypothetical protein